MKHIKRALFSFVLLSASALYAMDKEKESLIDPLETVHKYRGKDWKQYFQNGLTCWQKTNENGDKNRTCIDLRGTKLSPDKCHKCHYFDLKSLYQEQQKRIQ